VLFGDVWRRPGLSPRDRSLITVACLISTYRTNELPFHMKTALANGVTRDEIIEVITHLAFLRRLAAGQYGSGDCRQGVRRGRINYWQILTLLPTPAGMPCSWSVRQCDTR
jgi:hypothetical protein